MASHRELSFTISTGTHTSVLLSLSCSLLGIILGSGFGFMMRKRIFTVTLCAVNASGTIRRSPETGLSINAGISATMSSAVSAIIINESFTSFPTLKTLVRLSSDFISSDLPSSIK